MKILKKFFCFILGLTMLAGFPDVSAVAESSSDVNVLIYMIGSDLESRHGYATADLNEIISSAKRISNNVNILVYGGGTKKWHNTWFSNTDNCVVKIDKNGPQLLFNDGAKNMEDWHTLEDFLRYCRNNYTSGKNILILWDHGGGALGGFGNDERYNTSDYLSLYDISQAIDNVGIHFDLLGFDACLMGSVETVFVLQDYADYIVASEEVENVSGWDYSFWISKSFSSGQKFDAEQIGINIVDSYIESSTKIAPNLKATLSVTDTAAFIQKVNPAFSEFASYCNSVSIEGDYSKISHFLSESKKISYINSADSADLIHVAQAIDSEQSNVLINALKESIVYNKATSAAKNMNGLSVLFPYKETNSDSIIAERVKAFPKTEVKDAYTEWVNVFTNFRQFCASEDSGDRTLYDIVYNTGVKSLDGDDDDDILSMDIDSTQMHIGKIESYMNEHSYDPEKTIFSVNTDDSITFDISDEQSALVLKFYQETFYQEDGQNTVLGNIYVPNIGDGIEEILQFSHFNGYWLFIDGQICPFFMNNYEYEEGVHFTVEGYIPVIYNEDEVGILCAQISRDLNTEQLSSQVLYYQPIDLNGASDHLGRICPVSMFNVGDTISLMTTDYYDYEDYDIATYYVINTLTYNGDNFNLECRKVQSDEAQYMTHSYFVEDIYGEYHMLSAK